MGDEAYLYVMANAADGWPVKVGVANNPQRRAATLQTGNPKELMLLRTWKFSSRRLAFDIEQAILDELRPYIVRGEWIHADTFGMCGLIDDVIAEKHGGVSVRSGPHKDGVA